MKRLTVILFGLASLCAGSAQAALITWWAQLDTDQEVPVPNVAGFTPTGAAEGTVDDVTGELTWTLKWDGLTGDPLAAHFHGPAAPGVPAGVQVDLGLPAGSGASGMNQGSATIDAGQIADLLAGLWYLNVHTLANVPGEIRGQIAARIPEPATFGLLLCGVFGVYLRRRSA